MHPLQAPQVQFTAPKGNQEVIGLDIAAEAQALAAKDDISYAEALGRVKQAQR